MLDYQGTAFSPSSRLPKHWGQGQVAAAVGSGGVGVGLCVVVVVLRQGFSV